jgi:putative copper export protein
MWAKFVPTMPTLFDLLILSSFIGALGCRLWVLPQGIKSKDTLAFEVLLSRIWRLIFVCTILLLLSSTLLLITRAAEMSDLPVLAIHSVIPKVIFNTHYGHIWLVRIVAIIMLAIGWLIGRKRLDSRSISAFMLGFGLIIAFTRSASSHASDAGDLRLPELMDWFHLMTALFWGGGLLILTTLVLPTVIKHANDKLTFIAEIASRFSALAGLALSGALVTGLYNGWFEVGSFHALWQTPYGNTLIAKSMLLLTLVFLGASNRYVSVPLLKHWTDPGLTKKGVIYNLFFARYFTSVRNRLDWTQIAREFMRKLWLEAILIFAVLICVALLRNQVPARHFLNLEHGHGIENPVQGRGNASARYGF